jgi:hypothetical protein
MMVFKDVYNSWLLKVFINFFSNIIVYVIKTSTNRFQFSVIGPNIVQQVLARRPKMVFQFFDQFAKVDKIMDQS